MEPITVAAVQMFAGRPKAENLATATRLVERAAAEGAQLVALPELFNLLTRIPEVAEQAEPIPGPTSQAMSALARRLNITLAAGSIAEQSSTPGKAYNTALVFGPDGALLAKYRKMHLYDVNLPGQLVYEESRQIDAGREVVALVTGQATMGLAICYDLRFPELFRALADRGMDVLLIPSAFADVTGRDHFETLLRARAIENQCFVIAPNQHGQHAKQFATYGHSMILDPWGRVLASMGQGEGVITARLDPQRLIETRTRLPALTHRKL